MSSTENYRAKYNFTQHELSQRSQDLCDAVDQREQLMAEKKEIVSTFKAKIEAKESDIRQYASHIKNGYEYRDYQCRVVKDFDNHKKDYYDIASGDLIGTEKLTALDYQTKIDD